MFSFDLLQVVFWSITYVLIVVFGIIKRKTFMPIVAALFNISWELNSLLSDFFCVRIPIVALGHFVWIGLDFLIITIAIFYYVDNNKKMLLSFIFLPFIIIGLYFIFKINYGQLYSSFIIDLLVAICYLFVSFKEKDNIIEFIIIGITRFIGDFFAFIMYRQDTLVNIIGIIVFVINAIYLIILNNKPINKIKLTINKNEIY